ncbi:hypothetical protein PFICI_14508 [Pestalotiopsis fici W106-1]|uniref:F-box domain-containing protein n=1 Tax=Pestalotiopsis fici (strain W106-1 / CGMCC3.15140) TaxID=1229662 RepID=W3WK74_PESFW|nr:uncharacterized protein PFICI_14508 [Pestalotiopsis fici W106-1]ETS73562.1 hypothetical protein PFICI_14508 [Pestalotiopsis fici W106-1]
MESLPDDAYHQIFAYLPQQTLVGCRLLNRRIAEVATYYAFQRVRLRAADGVHSFVNVAKSESLRQRVREITIDTWVGPDCTYGYGKTNTVRLPRDFFRALAYVRFFPHLSTLNLRFSEYCGPDTRNGLAVDETWDLRYLVLDIVFRCVARVWPEAHRPLREENYVSFDRHDRGTLPPLPTEGILLNDDETLEPIHLRTLTVSNLADFDDRRLTDSDHFKQIMTSKSLKSIKLLVTEESNRGTATPVYFADKYDFCDNLPSTWLAPEIAENLTVLSLFFQNYWGWVPKMDFRAVNPGKGRASGLPNLRVLALGHYVFSHEWQIDWIASMVGHDNGLGGLQELYLDECPILWQARTAGPLDQSTKTYVSQDGDIISRSQNGYPLKSMMTNTVLIADAPLSERVQFAGSLHWSDVLHHWADHMTALRVFKMGQGCWSNENKESKWRTIQTYEHRPSAAVMSGLQSAVNDIRLKHDRDAQVPWSDLAGGLEAKKKQMLSQIQSFGDTTHLDYDCPSPSARHVPGTPYGREFLPRLGVGMSVRDKHILQYIHFDIDLGPTPWINHHRGENMPAIIVRLERFRTYIGERPRDMLAYNHLQGTVSWRAKTNKNSQTAA